MSLARTDTCGSLRFAPDRSLRSGLARHMPGLAPLVDSRTGLRARSGLQRPIRQRVAGLGSQPTPECGFPRKDAGRRPSQEPVAKTAAMAGRASAARAHPEPAQVGDRAAPFRIARASPRRARRTGLPAFACGAIDRWLLRGAGGRPPGIEPRRFPFRTRPACRRERPAALRRVESRPLNDAGRRLGSPPDRATAPVAARHRA